MDNLKTPFSRRIVPWLALVGLIVLAFIIVAPFLVPLAWAGIICYASWPIALRIQFLCNKRYTLAASIATLLAAITFVLPLIWLIWLAQKELAHVYPAVQTFLSATILLPKNLNNWPWLGEWLREHVDLFANPQGVSMVIKDWLASHSNDIAMLVGDIGKNMIKLLFVLLILFFFYRDGAKIMHELRHVLTRFIGPQAQHYLHAAGTTTRAVVYGILLTALVQGIAAGFGYWVAGLSSPVILGVITALCALIPFCTPLAWGSIGLWLLIQGHTAGAIGIWLYGAIVISQLDNVLRPVFIASVSPIPFLFILFGVLGGLLAFGLVGLFIGPIVLTVAWAVWREWTTHLQANEQRLK